MLDGEVEFCEVTSASREWFGLVSEADVDEEAAMDAYEGGEADRRRYKTVVSRTGA